MDELIEVSFNFEEDMVISVGDLVDRGKDSLKCIELIKNSWFKAIRGNHEQMCLEASIAPEMKEFHCKHGGEWLYELSMEKYEEVQAICLNLPIVLEIVFEGKKYGFVHADI
ncbi:metallophosphoesterase, partial [Acinetobacter baumannii]|nr:metallophosphoesterase [Acinetobacter baumannii]